MCYCVLDKTGEGREKDRREKAQGRRRKEGGQFGRKGRCMWGQAGVEWAEEEREGDVFIFTLQDLESSFVVWKGGCVLSCLDTAQELWIERPEWEFSGVRLLRERAPFLW